MLLGVCGQTTLGRSFRLPLFAPVSNHIRLTLHPLTMAHIVTPLDQPSNYKDSQSRVDRSTQNDLLSKTSTLYVCLSLSWFQSEAYGVIKVGNLSFYTTEEQIYELFSKCTTSEDGGGIKRIIMGLDRNTRYITSH